MSLETTLPSMQTVKDMLAENFTGAAHNSSSAPFSLDQVPDLSGKVAVVTGGSEGIGYGCTHTLLSKNIGKLFITSRREEKGEEALEAIEQELGPEARKKVTFVQTDNQDWPQTAQAANEIAKQTDRIDILILNAARGIMTYQLAPSNGTDIHFAVNHAGHHVFVSHLLPTLKKTAEAGHTVRINFLSSSLHSSCPKETKFASLDEINTDLGPNAQYGRAKMMNLLHSRYLDRHLHSQYPNILVNATHPGIVDTAQTNDHIHEAFPLMGYGMSALMKPFKKSQFEGCVSTMFAATVTTGSGQYINPPSKVEEGDPRGKDVELQEQLMKLTREIVEQKTKEQSSAKGCPFKDY